MNIRELMEQRALQDAIAYLDARITKLEEAATKPEPEPPTAPVTAEEEGTENG